MMELMRLSELYAKAPDPRSKEREKQFPGYYTNWCYFKFLYNNLNLVDSVILVHGSQGCVANMRTFLSPYQSQYFGQPFIYSPCTNMNSSDTILGSDEKLTESIFEVDRIYKPRLIFVMLTCAPGVTRESVEEQVESIKEEIEADIMVIRSEGFQNYSTGIAHRYLSRKIAELFREPEKKIPRSVNILGVSKEVHYPGNFCTDSQELERLLNKMGVTINSVLLQSASYERVIRAPEAEFNTLECPLWGKGMAEVMKERFGIHHGKRINPLGVTEISHWLMEVGEFFGLEKETKKVIAEEYDQIKDVWEEAKRLVEGKIVLIDGADPMGYVGRGLAQAKMCRDLGMEAIFFNMSPIEVKGCKEHVEAALEEGFDPKFVYSDYAYHRRFSPTTIIKELGLNFDDVSLYLSDVFPKTISEWDKPIFDPSNSPRVISTIHCSRKRGYPGRMVGFKGAESFAKSLISAVNMAKRNKKPTLYGRLSALR